MPYNRTPREVYWKKRKKRQKRGRGGTERGRERGRDWFLGTRVAGEREGGDGEQGPPFKGGHSNAQEMLSVAVTENLNKY